MTQTKRRSIRRTYRTGKPGSRTSAPKDKPPAAPKNEPKQGSK